MRWTRPRPGLYTAGPYTVERHDHAGGFWTASGPGVPAHSYRSREEAGAQCEDAAQERIVGNEATVEPVRGDVALVCATGRVGTITSVFGGDNGHPLYCIRLPRGRRVCIHRNELEVLVP